MAALDEEAIFQVARQIDRPEPRRLYLDQACGPNAALRARVEALLRAFDEGRSFLERPALVPPGESSETAGSETASIAPALAGATIAGRYKLLQPIGEGGMGAVWMVEQTEPVRRTVALKIIRPGLDSAQIL